ncbi:MAG TPA: sialidase family protein [Armatimonadota bacterium]|nr:sialidase family protein [Armatimonadota bacterium]
MKIARIAPLSYTPGKLEYFCFIRGGIGADYHQNPVFHQFANGEVRLCWGAYDFDECSDDSVTLYSASRDRGLTWSDPQVYMADYPAGPLSGMMLRLRGGDRALMLVQQVRHRIVVDEARRVATAGSNYFEARTHVFIRRSADGGRSFDHGEVLTHTQFTDGKELPGGGFYGSVDELTQLQSGRVLAAFMFMDPERCDPTTRLQHYTVACLLSDDGGQTWRRSNEITADTPRGAMEVQIAETEPDRLFCLFRTKGGCLYQTISEDGGETWRPSEPSPLTAPESMARMIRLHSGNLLVVWNNVASTTQRPRYPLVAALSPDGGRTWGDSRVIADEVGTNQLSNHGMIQLDDGRILLAISHYRDVRPMTSDLDIALLDEDWLRDG